MCDRFSHRFRFLSSALCVAGGTGFLIYSTYVTNNLQVVGESWLNDSYVRTHHELPSQEHIVMLWACVIASKEVGKILGTLMLPFVAERWGRKFGLQVNNVLTFVGCAMCYAGLHAHYSLIMAGRVILGITMICGVGLASLYLIEIAPIADRGKSGSLIQIFRGLGGTLGMAIALPQLMGTSELWTLCLAVPAIPTFILFIVMMFAPESPRHLYITEGKTLQATKAVHFYQGKVASVAVLTDLEKERDKIKSQPKVKWYVLIRRKDFWGPTSMVTLALTNRSLAGILLVQSYSTDMFISAGVEHKTAALSTVVLGLCHLVSAIAVTFTVDHYGRKPMLLFGNIGCAITLAMVAVFATNTWIPGSPILTVLSLSVFMLIYPILASVSNIVASEICHQKIRSVAFTIGLLVYSIVGLISTFLYPLIKAHIGFEATFAPYVTAMVFTATIFYLYLPETKGKTFESLAFGSQREQSVPLLNGTGVGSDTEDMTPGGRKFRSVPMTSDEEDDFEDAKDGGLNAKTHALNGDASNNGFLGGIETDEEV